MKRALITSLPIAAIAVWLIVAQGPPAAASLAGNFPAGALLFVEARDFGGILRDWDSSRTKQLWLASANYQQFSRSRLYQRLQDAQQEFAAAAGAPPDMALLQSVAGTQSALAIYNIGRLELLYITRLASTRAMETATWKSRARFEARNAAGKPYYVRVDPASRRVAAFAFLDDTLVLGTREDLVGGALMLISGQPAAAMKSERWYDDAVRAAGTPGDLRLIADMRGVAATPHFRSYWIQRNVPELRQYGAVISDLYRTPEAYREDRKLIRFDGGAAPRAGELGNVLRLVPPDAGMYRAWAAPGADRVIELLARDVLLPGPTEAVPTNEAPEVSLTGTAGSEEELETRIDEPPLKPAAGFDPAALRALAETADVQAMLELGSTRVLPDRSFVGIRSAVALLGSADWDIAAARGAVVASFENLLTASGAGARWVEQHASGHTYWELDGLHRVAVAADGKLLVLANGREAIEPVLARLAAPPEATDATYAAGFRQAARTNFVRILRMIETATSGARETDNPAGRAPLFFSQNLASLSRSLGAIDSVAIRSRDDGRMVSETVTYRLGPR